MFLSDMTSTSMMEINRNLIECQKNYHENLFVERSIKGANKSIYNSSLNNIVG